MMDVTVIRQPLKGNFTQVDNKFIEDTRLSCHARILLEWIIGRHPDFKNHCFDKWQEVIGVGYRKLKKVLSELVEYGYAYVSQNRNQYGQFQHDTYEFYSSPSVNPHLEGLAVDTTPSDGSGKDTYNTSSNTSCSLSVYPEMEQNDSAKNVEIVENAENEETLTDCIQRNIEQITAEKPELKEKLSRLEMPIFVTYLAGVLQNALQTLKHPKAKAKFIKNTIFNQIKEFKAKKPSPAPETKPAETPVKPEISAQNEDKPTPLTHTLALIGSKLMEKSFIDEEAPDCENIEYFYNFPLSIMEEDIQNCTLPYSLKNDKKALRDAIEYVTSYCYDRYEQGYKEAQKDTSFRYFIDAVVDTLTEIITTERVGKRVVHYYEYIDKINRIIRISGNLYEFVVDFEYYFRRLLEAKSNEGDLVRNQKRYLTAVLSDFLMCYNADKIIPTWCGE